MEIKSNQYGFPCKTYYYIVNEENKIWHRDGKWRKKSLIQLWSHGFKTESEAILQLNKLNQQ